MNKCLAKKKHPRWWISDHSCNMADQSKHLQGHMPAKQEKSCTALLKSVHLIIIIIIIIIIIMQAYICDIIIGNHYHLMSISVSPGWVNELLAGGAGGAKGFMFFICNMELTTEGQGNPSMPRSEYKFT